jgi:hypothetical protein
VGSLDGIEMVKESFGCSITTCTLCISVHVSVGTFIVHIIHLVCNLSFFGVR